VRPVHPVPALRVAPARERRIRAILDDLIDRQQTLDFSEREADLRAANLMAIAYWQRQLTNGRRRAGVGRPVRVSPARDTDDERNC